MRHRLAHLAAAVLLALAAAPAAAEPRLLDRSLRLALLDPAPAVPSLTVAAQGAPAEPPMDFDLLGEPEQPPPPSDVRRTRLRNRMMTVHQGIGLGLVGLQLGTTVVGQLNYSDKFADGPNTNRYKSAHKVLAYTNLGVFLAGGALAYLAPAPRGRTGAGVDRIWVHRVATAVAAVGMASQGVIGLYTARREGYGNQERIATAHLAIGYGTLAALLVGLGAIVSP